MNKIINRIVFNFTDSCNLRCKFCYLPWQDTSVELDIVFRIFDILPQLARYNITIGGGEPFRYKSQVYRLIEKTKQQTIQIDSNGTLINSDDIKFLQRNHVKLSLSIDDIGELHDKIRGKVGLFEEVRNVLNYSMKNDYRIKINTVLTRYNYMSLISIHEFISSFPISNWDIYEFWPMERGLKNKDQYYFPLSYQSLLPMIQK